MSDSQHATTAGAAPQAVPLPHKRAFLPRLLPLLALALAAWLAWQGWGERGPRIVVKAREGYGIKAGDALRYRGITVGEVRSVRLSEDLSEVRVEMELVPAAAAIARKGSRFWIVRPHLALDGVSGLETIVGARYLSVIPGAPEGPSQHEFFALPEPPLLEELEEGGLEIRLEARARDGLLAGAPIRYRGQRVGTVLSVGLASDASHVDVRAWILPPYARLVHTDSVFWETGGIEADLDLLGGLRFELDSLQGLLVGGVAFATPDSSGEAAGMGHSFVLHEEAQDEWREWSPQLPVGHSLLPAGSTLPTPLRVALRWKSGRLWKRQRERFGWSLLLSDGLVGPENLLVPTGDEEHEETLEVAGFELPLQSPLASAEGAARLGAPLDESLSSWPRTRVRTLSEQEDLLLVTDPALPPMALSAARLTGNLELDPTLSLGDSWHGAAVVARKDGMLVGILLVEDGARIAPVP